MTNRPSLFAVLLPLAALALAAAAPIGSAGSPPEAPVLAQAGTLDAAPRSRSPIRGARPAPAAPAEVEKSRPGDTEGSAGDPPGARS